MSDRAGSMKKRNASSGWSELCPELLIKFVTPLNSGDRLAFRGVCRGWRSASLAAQKEIKTGKELISHSEFPDGDSDHNKQVGIKRKSFTTETFSMRKRRNVSDFRWSKLCPELLMEIYSHIDSMDQSAFRCVCKGWRLALQTAMKMESMKTKTRVKEEFRNVSNRWSELFPDDLLIELYAGLDVVDQLSFRGVCKGWRSAAMAAPEQQKKQLWLMYRGDCYDQSSLYYFVNFSSSRRPSYHCRLPILDSCSILTAKHGWLLIVRVWTFPIIQIFFYDPFTHTTITLPPLTLPVWVDAYNPGKDRNRSKIDFTAPPTSPECMVVAVFYHKMLNRLVTSSWRHGQAAWATPVKHEGLTFGWLPVSAMVFHEEIFYCICNKQMVGKVLAFHPEMNTVKSLSGGPSQADPGKGETGSEYVLCDLLSPSASNVLVERMGGLEFVEELVRRRESGRRPQSRSVKVREGNLPVEKSVVKLGEIELGYPPCYQPFLQKGEGQLMVVHHHPWWDFGRRVWITKRWVPPNAPY